MKKILTILILLQLVYSASNAQIKLIGNITTNGKASYPTHIDSLGKGGMMVMPTKDSRDSIPLLRRKFGMLVYVQENDSLYKLNNTASAKKFTDSTDWISIGLSSSAELNARDNLKVNVSDTAAMLQKYARKFTKNVKLNLATGRTLGKYNVGDSVYAAGKTLDEFLYDISTVQIAPSYSAPTASVSISGTSSFEIGTRMDLLPSINLLYTFNKADAGLEVSPSTAIFYKNGASLGAGVTSDAAAGTVSGATRILTTSINYTVQNISYTDGAIKNDNLGNPYPTGKISAGAINGSNTASITTFQYSYYGASTTSVVSDYFKTTLKSAGKSQTLSFSSLVNEYIFYAYPSALGNLTSIKIGGFESLDAFNRTTVNLVNASGYSMPYIVYTSQNFFNGSVTGIIFQ